MPAAAALHQQGQQADAVNGQDEKDGDLHAGAVFVFLLRNGALWQEWILVIHILIGAGRLFFEELVWF